MNNRQTGFTVIEVILFVAISGLLLVGAFVAMRSAFANTQFNDTTDSTQSYLQRLYLDVATGVNVRDDNVICTAQGRLESRPGDPTNAKPGASECVILGRLLQIEPGNDAAASRITTRYLSSAEVNDVGQVSDLQAFGADGYQVRISSDAVPLMKGSFELPWSAYITSAKRQGFIDVQDVKSLAILRSPVSERMMVYAFAESEPDPAAFASAENLLTNSQRTIMCIQSDDGLLAKKATLTVWPGQSQDLFEINRSGDDLAACTSGGLGPITPPDATGGGD